MKARISAALLLALSPCAAGQSMGEAARKERERRDKLHAAGTTTRTVKDDDLASNKGTLANDPKAEPAKTAEEAAGRRTPREPTARPSAPARGEEYWRTRVAQAREAVLDAKERHDALQRMIVVGQPEQYDANGRRVLYSPYPDENDGGHGRGRAGGPAGGARARARGGPQGGGAAGLAAIARQPP